MKIEEIVLITILLTIVGIAVLVGFYFLGYYIWSCFVEHSNDHKRLRMDRETLGHLSENVSELWESLLTLQIKVNKHIKKGK